LLLRINRVSFSADANGRPHACDLTCPARVRASSSRADIDQSQVTSRKPSTMSKIRERLIVRLNDTSSTFSSENRATVRRRGKNVVRRIIYQSTAITSSLVSIDSNRQYKSGLTIKTQFSIAVDGCRKHSLSQSDTHEIE